MARSEDIEEAMLQGVKDVLLRRIAEIDATAAEAEAEHERLRETLAALYEATADLLDHVTGMTEGEPTPIFEAAERALSEAGVCLGRTGRDG